MEYEERTQINEYKKNRYSIGTAIVVSTDSN